MNPGDTFTYVVTCPDCHTTDEVEMTAHGNGYATWHCPCSHEDYEHTVSMDDITLGDDDPHYD